MFQKKKKEKSTYMQIDNFIFLGLTCLSFQMVTILFWLLTSCHHYFRLKQVIKLKFKAQKFHVNDLSGLLNKSI